MHSKEMLRQKMFDLMGSQIDIELIRDIMECIESGFYTAALATLFIFFEMKIREHAEDEQRTRLENLIDTIRKNGKIDKTEADTLKEFKNMRNNFAHNYSFPNGIEANGKFYSFIEKDTHRIILESNLTKKVMDILIKLKNSDSQHNLFCIK